MTPSLDKKQLNKMDTTARRAFTLVELLVVISIIAVLAALLIPAVMVAKQRADSTRIKLEIDSLDTAFEDYRNDVGGEYPPNAWYVNASNNNSNTLLRHFKKAFPRSREPEEVILQICGINQGGSPGSPGGSLPGGMQPAEALVFWLGGFSSDPKYPISGPGGPSFDVGNSPQSVGIAASADTIEDRQRTFDFEISRLGVGDGIDMKTTITDETLARAIQYRVNVNGNQQTRQINFWQYYPPKSTVPFVYFDTSRSIPNVDENSIYPSSLAPLKRLEATVTNTTTATPQNLRYANEDKFQILHAGIDDDWGDFAPIRINFFTEASTTLPNLSTPPLLVPDGPFVAELGDTITNFDERTLQDAQP